MAKLSIPAIYNAARRAGFSPNDAVTMTAIALAESGGNPDAYNGNVNTGDNSYGLWQINMIGNLGAPRRAQFGINDNNQLFDPATNAHAAYLVAGNGRSFAPWSTYKSGAYTAYLAPVMSALGMSGHSAPPATAPGGAAAAAASPAGFTAQPVGVLPGGNWNPGNWLLDPLASAAETKARQIVFYAAGLGLGAGLLMIGAWRGFEPTRRKVTATVQTVRQAATTAGEAAAA